MVNMDAAAAAATDLLRALASPVRLKILCQLVEGEKSVGQLAALLGVRETLISQHLTLLRKDGLVRNRRMAQTIFYALNSPAAERIIRVLYEVFCVDNAAEASAPKAGGRRTAAADQDGKVEAEPDGS